MENVAIIGIETKGAAVAEIVRKAVSLELDEAKEGTFIARIVTLDVIDKDSDVTVSGAVENNTPVLISAYQHNSWMGDLPVGKAFMFEEDGQILAKGEFNLKSESGREHYESVKFSAGLQEWSYGFKVLEVGDDKTIDKWAEQHDGARPQRIIKKFQPFEISPVLLGAGIETGTLAIKSEATYADEADTVLAAVSDLVIRTKSLAGLRLKEGRVLSSKNRERMSKLFDTLSEVASDLKELLDATEPAPDADEKLLASAVLLMTKIKRELLEVT